MNFYCLIWRHHWSRWLKSQIDHHFTEHRYCFYCNKVQERLRAETEIVYEA